MMTTLVFVQVTMRLAPRTAVQKARYESVGVMMRENNAGFDEVYVANAPSFFGRAARVILLSNSTC